jgi:hypothetical protein
MQTHPWEPWDLLSVLGEGGAWLADFAGVRNFYTALAAVRSGRCDIETARRAAALIAADPHFPPLAGEVTDHADGESIARKLVFSPPTQRERIAQWLRLGSPLARHMHRNTRDTLRHYYATGVLADPPPRRKVEDIVFDFAEAAEREVYNSVSQYIEKRFQELEQEKLGKGFVMTVYRRRASSSPLALERSLARRREGLRRVVERKAYDFDLRAADIPEALDVDDLPEEEAGARISAALPQNPQVARNELAEVERLLDQLLALRGRDTKRDRFFEVLRRITEDGRPVLVFTEYTDTLEYLRDSLVDHYGKGLACYSGDGGQRWDGTAWTLVTKDAITKALRNGELRVLICTDAASEGLNLQAAGALINYDLPWNPSKVEQRIGRIDRIGQKFPTALIVNLFLKNSVDDKVYRALRSRCGLFEHFVGAMQPVLARARRMLAGQEPVDLSALETTATVVEHDPLAGEAYIESVADKEGSTPPAVTRSQIEDALLRLKGEFGPRVKADKVTERFELSDLGLSKVVFSSKVDVLERDRSVIPLSPFDSRLRAMAERLNRTGERLPLMIGSYHQGAFRCSVAYWVGEEGSIPVRSFEELERLVEGWKGDYPDPERWLRTEQAAQAEAEQHVRLLQDRAAQREREGLERQMSAVRLRLQRELGRYLASLGVGTADLNELLHQQMTRDIAGAQRLKQAFTKLGGYPDWSPDLLHDLEFFASQLTENQRRARLLGKELDAALEDPRWTASVG